LPGSTGKYWATSGLGIKDPLKSAGGELEWGTCRVIERIGWWEVPPSFLRIGRINELATKSAQGCRNKRVVGKVAQTKGLASAVDLLTFWNQALS
jgi:hypothetical protein